MPKHSNVIQFSLDQFVRFELQKLKLPEESSIAVTAKRILLSALHPESSKELAPIADLEAITERLSLLEQSFQDFLQRYVDLEDNLNDLKPQVAVTQARLSKLEEELKQAPGRSKQPSRDQNGRFIQKGGKG